MEGAIKRKKKNQQSTYPGIQEPKRDAEIARARVRCASCKQLSPPAPLLAQHNTCPSCGYMLFRGESYISPEEWRERVDEIRAKVAAAEGEATGVFAEAFRQAEAK